MQLSPSLSPSPINPANSLQDLTITCEGGYDECDWSDSEFEDEPEEEGNMEEETGSILSASTSNTNIAASASNTNIAASTSDANIAVNTSNTNIAATQNIANISADISASKTSVKDVSSLACSSESVKLVSWNLLRLSEKCWSENCRFTMRCLK